MSSSRNSYFGILTGRVAIRYSVVKINRRGERRLRAHASHERCDWSENARWSDSHSSIDCEDLRASEPRTVQPVTEVGHQCSKDPLTLQVHPDYTHLLGEEAKPRGISGHTTMARLLLEAAGAKPKKALVEEIAEAVVARLGRRLAG
jgi:hypothetical protein